MLSMERFRERYFRLSPTWHFVKLVAHEAILKRVNENADGLPRQKLGLPGCRRMGWNRELSRRRLAWQSPLGVKKGSTA
jgi:hypothetical protein